MDNGSKVLDLELAHRLIHFDNVQVFRVEESPVTDCDPGRTAGTDELHCYPIAETVAAPHVGWARSMTSLVVWDSEFRDEDVNEFREPAYAVRYVSSFGNADVLLSLRRKRLAVASGDLRPAVGSFAKSYERVLLLLASAMPRDRELRELLALEDSVRVDANEAAGPDQPYPLWGDCVPPSDAPVTYEEEPTPLTAPTPAYPADARASGIQGTVVLQAYIEEDGIPCWVKVVSGDPALVGASVEALRAWRFRPATRDGNPLAVWIEIPMVFQLEERAFDLHR